MDSRKKDQDDDTGNIERPDAPEQDVIDRISLMVSRFMIVQTLARVGVVDMEIQWDKRLHRLRREMIGVLRKVLSATGDSDNARGS